jgi:hypothetical protein
MALAGWGQRHPSGTTPGSPQPRFPGYDVMAQRPNWDEETAAVVVARLGPAPPLRFFDEDEEPTARALVDRLLGQDDEPRVPAFELLDARLSEHQGDGYRFEDMPEDWDVWHRSIQGLDADCRDRFQAPFHALAMEDQMDVVEGVRTATGNWHGMPAGRAFSVLMRYVCTAFYSHPWAWNEIGFGGPAYPRGYVNLGLDRRETWERREVDAEDPIPWVDRTEAARKAHAVKLPNRGPE